jgi:hypothetical protein
VHWPIVLLALGLLIVLALLAPRAARALRGWIERRRAAYAASEAASFAHLRKIAHRGDPAATYFALLAWLERFAPVAPTHTLKAFREAAQDPTLDRDLALIEAHLFARARGADAAAWSARQSLHRISLARRRLLHQPAAVVRSITRPLNPLDPYALGRATQRTVAR